MKGVCLECWAPRDGFGHHPNTDPHRTAQPQHGRVALCMVFVAACVLTKRFGVASLCLCVSVRACILMFLCMPLILCPKFYVDLCSAVKSSSCTLTDILSSFKC